MRQSNIVRALSGFLLAIALIVGGGYLTTQFVIAKFTELPPRPTFPNDKPSSNSATPAAAKAAANQPKASPAVAVSPSPTPTPSTTPSPKSDGNLARIALGEGLNVRENPSVEAGRVGGVDYNEVVVVLETSPDQEWQKIRVEKSGLEGWIKSGYTEPVSPTAE